MKNLILILAINIVSNFCLYSQNTFIFNYGENSNAEYTILNLFEENNIFYTFIATNKLEYRCLKLNQQGSLLDDRLLSYFSWYTMKNNNTFISVMLKNIESNYSKFDLVISEHDLNLDILNTKVINFVNPNPNTKQFSIIPKVIYTPENELVFTINFCDMAYLTPNEVIAFKLDENYDIISCKYFDELSMLYPVDIDYIPQGKGFIISSIGNPLFISPEDAGFYRLDKDFNIEKIHTYTMFNNGSNYHEKPDLKFLTDSTFATNAIRYCGTGALADKFELIETDTTFQILNSVKFGLNNEMHDAALGNGLDFIDTNAIYFGGSKIHSTTLWDPPYYNVIAKANSQFSIV